MECEDSEILSHFRSLLRTYAGLLIKQTHARVNEVDQCVSSDSSTQLAVPPRHRRSLSQSHRISSKISIGERLWAVFDSQWERLAHTGWVRIFETEKFLDRTIIQQLWLDLHVAKHAYFVKLMKPLQGKRWINARDFVAAAINVYVEPQKGFFQSMFQSDTDQPSDPHRLLFFFASLADRAKSLPPDRLTDIFLLERKQARLTAQVKAMSILEYRGDFEQPVTVEEFRRYLFPKK